jgi:hypothetical protein
MNESCKGGTICVCNVTVCLAWNLTNGVNIDFEPLANLLDENYQLGMVIHNTILDPNWVMSTF